MSYQDGLGPGNGYGQGYEQPGGYPQQNFQQQYIPDPVPRTSWDPMTMQPQMHQMQQMEHLQPHNQATYYQQQQYVPLPNVSPPNNYYQDSIRSTAQYPQYAQPRQQFQPHYQQPSQRQYQSPIQQHYQIPQPQQLVPPPQQNSPFQHHSPQPQTHSRPQASQQVLPNPKQRPPKKQAAPQQPQPPRQPSTSVSNVPIQNSLKQSQASTKPVDAHMLLIALAEEYFAAAHSMSPTLARNMQDNLVDEYQKLIATGLGCLEVSLKQTHTKFAPRLEARIRLRYAAVLFEETENYMEAETCLSQGITLCEQNRYLDIKYSMQALLAQLIYKKSPKAALISLERHCTDAAAYKHYCWEYVFRFLKASLCMKSGRASDAHTALSDLHYICNLAQERGDHAVYVLSSSMEILVHLMNPSPESNEQLQSSFAAVWTYQTTTDCQIPQLQVLTHVLGVTSGLLHDPPPKTVPKQKLMEETFSISGWSTSSDVISVPIKKTRAQDQIVSEVTRGFLEDTADGRDSLIVSFLNNNDAFALTYLLSGIAMLHNNCIDGKALNYFRKGLSSISGGIVSRKAVSDLPDALLAFRWRRVLTSYFHVYMILCHAANSEWKGAKEQLQHLKENLQEIMDSSSRRSLGLFYSYLSGLHFQGIGDLDAALEMYKDPGLQLEGKVGLCTTPEEQLQQDLAVLASLNALWILQEGIHYDPSRNAAMIAELEPLCAEHHTIDIRTAFNLVKATVTTKPPISSIKTKRFLSDALEAAKITENKQFLSIILSIMCSRFFVGVVGDQAEKAGRAAVIQAQRARNTLWMSVSNSLLAENLETQGKVEESRTRKADAYRLAMKALPGTA